MIDSTAVMGLITIEDREPFALVKDLESIFINQAPELFQQMRKGIEAEDSDLIVRSALTLSASCSYLGIVDMVTICSQIKAAAARGPAGHFEVSMLLKQLESTYYEDAEQLKNLIVGLQEQKSPNNMAKFCSYLDYTERI